MNIDPRRIELNRIHSREMGLLYQRFVEVEPAAEAEADGVPLTAQQEAGWRQFSADLRAQHHLERSALDNVIDSALRQS